MTAEQRAKLFAQIFALLDSGQPAERTAALDKLHALRSTHGWPSFADLLRKLERTVTSEQFEAVEKNLAEWMEAHDARVAENTALARRNAALKAQVTGLRAALWIRTNRRLLVTGCLVLAVGLAGARAGWRWWDLRMQAEDGDAKVSAGLHDVLSRTRWGNGDTSPTIVRIAGVDYWVLVHGTVDTASHADARGRPVERHCLQLFATEAQRDAVTYLAPRPSRALAMKARSSSRSEPSLAPKKKPLVIGKRFF